MCKTYGLYFINNSTGERIISEFDTIEKVFKNLYKFLNEAEDFITTFEDVELGSTLSLLTYDKDRKILLIEELMIFEKSDFNSKGGIFRRYKRLEEKEINNLGFEIFTNGKKEIEFY